ncbi:peptidase M61 [Marinilongibacter aquaticus]|uniref:M61 family metallopeptidase n=1 Tax=Marinilongibacter aquaticus TaxID=2975157 RepID=UPI0021BDD1C1|nr:peptidase M61 [Marinilongibacter aquaticus]UBM59467.1 peptidase M61 [Marinilongibacter aquaticus]
MIKLKTSVLAVFALTSFIGMRLHAQVKYTLSMPEPETHYFQVQMDVENILTNSKLLDKNHLTVKMPVWTPGSYLVREYAKNIDHFAATTSDGQALPFRKVNKNTWEISLNGADDVKINYDVYAYELTVRTSFLDEDHGYANGASVFLYVPELMQEQSQLTVQPYEKWSTVSTALPETGKNTYAIKDFDTLVDSPIEVGNHEMLSFEAAGVPHKIAMFSTEPLQYDKAKFLGDFKKMVEAATSVVGETPLDHYLFIIHHSQGIGGGLEHLFSTTCQTRPNAYANDYNYKNAFSLFAHEYFHLWNVKRIRPVALGPFDYDKENYTHMLWVAEGFTSFYEEVILARAGLLNESEVLEHLADNYNRVLNAPGNTVQAATEASWDAWIKYYRPNENSSNVNISYYSKGGLLATLLNAKIIANTQAEKSLDDVLRILYKRYYQELGRGYTDDEFQAVCEEVYGGDLDYFFKNYISGIEVPDYATILKSVGIALVDENKDQKLPYLGIAERGGSIVNLNRLGSAYHSGLNVGDKLLSIDGKMGLTISEAMVGKNVGDKLQMAVERAGVRHEYEVTVGQNPGVKLRFSKMDKLDAGTEKAYHKFVNI